MTTKTLGSIYIKRRRNTMAEQHGEREMVMNSLISPRISSKWLRMYSWSKGRFMLSAVFRRNTKRLPENTLPQSTKKDVHSYIANYVEENAISLPGRIPGFKSDEVKVLPSSETKIGVWRVYETACKVADKHPVSYSTFLQIWGQFYPYVVISKPMTDPCMTCQQNTNKLQRAANLSEREKVECIRAHQDHINSAQSERDFYRTSCVNSKKHWKPMTQY